MANHFIPTNANEVFAAGTIAGNASLDNLHNVLGNVTYQIGVAPPAVIPMAQDEAPVVIAVNGLQFSVTNNLPSELNVEF